MKSVSKNESVRAFDVDDIHVTLFDAGAGSARGGARVQSIENCNGIVAWSEDGVFTQQAWADMMTALALHMRIFFGFRNASEPGGDLPDNIAWGIVPFRAAVFPFVPKDDAFRLSAMVFAHDPECECCGPDLDASGWSGLIARCETPIERRLVVHLLTVAERFPFDVLPQYSVVVDSKQYRLDFAVIEPSLSDLKIAIEADGHNYHERTKTQAARDRSRDRALTLAGWTVLRFTGSEIWRDPQACAQQVYDCVLKAYDKAEHAHV